MQRRKLLAVMGPILFGLSRFRTGTSASSTGESSLSTLLPPEIEKQLAAAIEFFQPQFKA